MVFIKRIKQKRTSGDNKENNEFDWSGVQVTLTISCWFVQDGNTVFADMFSGQSFALSNYPFLVLLFIKVRNK